ncbi:MAG: hypothetical protein AAGE52_09250 [Myxococcota bacterium]
MKWISLEVNDFGRVEHASFELGEGLNVFYGPNDLGKSTVGAAIRAVLLLPHTSAYANRFIPWDRDAKPEARLIFRGDDGRYWRVTKTFSKGSGGRSLLEVSNDGKTYTVEAKARQVDGELRKLLGWGIASPGGKNAPRGLPESFLTRALLGEQTSASDLLRATLNEDSDGTGRERLTQALQVFAQDPLFKRILDAATLRVGEAFSATGKPRKARGAPFVLAREDVKLARQARDQCLEELQNAERVQGEGDALRKDVTSAEDALRAAHAHAEETQRRRRLVVERASAEATLREVEEKHDAAAGVRKALAELDEALHSQEAKANSLREELETVETSLRQADAELAAAKANAQAALSDDAEREKALQVQRLEVEADVARRSLEHAEAVASLRARRTSAESKKNETLQELAKAKEELALATQGVTKARAEQDRLAGEKDRLALARLNKRIRDLEALVQDADALRKEATTKRAAATRTASKIEATPTEAQLQELEALQRELAVAEARLDVGIALALRQQPGVTTVAEVDETEAPVEGSTAELTGERRIRLEVSLPTGEPVIELVATGGRLEARAEAERLRTEWTETAEPHLNGESLTALRRKAKDAAEAHRKVSQLREDADRLEARSKELRAQTAELTTLQQRQRALLEHAGEEAPTFDDDEELRRALEAAASALRSAQDAQANAASRVQGLEGDVRDAERELELLTDEEDAPTVEEAKAKLSKVETTLGSLRSAQAQASASAREAVKSGQELVDDLRSRRDRLSHERREAEGARRETHGRRTALQEQSANLDWEALGSALAEATAARDAIERVDEVTDENVEAARRALRDAEAKLGDAQRTLDRHEGRLEHLGGTVAQERYLAAEEAFALAEQRQSDVEAEYFGWKLLVDTMRSAENDVGQHLGEALSKPVTDALRALLEEAGADAERYGAIAFGATLKTEGLRALGDVRGTDRLSVGTQEQIAALLRLTIAKALSAPLILDDHLTHTDPTRSAWFRDALRAAAHDTQMLVITCHPRSYLDADDLAHEGPYRERAAGLLRAIDAAQIIETS